MMRAELDIGSRLVAIHPYPETGRYAPVAALGTVRPSVSIRTAASHNQHNPFHTERAR